MEGVADPKIYAPPHIVLSCRIWSFYVKWYESYYGDQPEKIDPSPPVFQGSLRVIGTDTCRSATYINVP